MKCIQCDTDNTLKDRRFWARCKRCGHPFVFDPQKGSKFTDMFFNNALKAISAENTLYFTPKQFFYALENRRLFRKLFTIKWSGFSKIGCSFPIILLYLCLIILFLVVLVPPVVWVLFGRGIIIGIIIYFCKMLFRMFSSATHPKKRKNYARTLQGSGVLIIAGGIFFSLTLSNIPPAVAFSIFSIGIGLGLLLLYLAHKALNRLLYIPQSLYLKPSEVEDWVNSWTQVNEIPKILPPPNEETTSVAVSPDIASYSFDRVVVCDNNSIAQMLIANNFHFENNCAVLSITGYPQNIFNTVMQMLRLNPNLKVYALHDASPEGVSLLHRLGSSPNWFANSNVPIYDLGLFPRHVFASKSMLVRQSPEFAETARQLPYPVRQSLSKDELEWLKMGNYVELEFFTPQKLLQVVSQGIARSREPGRDNGMISIYGDGDDDNRSTSAMIFASESFG